MHSSPVAFYWHLLLSLDKANVWFGILLSGLERSCEGVRWNTAVSSKGRHGSLPWCASWPRSTSCARSPRSANDGEPPSASCFIRWRGTGTLWRQRGPFSVFIEVIHTQEQKETAFLLKSVLTVRESSIKWCHKVVERKVFVGILTPLGG